VKTLALATLAAAFLAAAPAVRAQTQTSSHKWGSLQLGAGPYVPNIDKEFDGATPYRDIFGNSPGPMFRLQFAKTVYDRAGSVEVGLRTGFWRKTGNARSAIDGSPTGDQTTFNIIPTSLTLTYRADQLFDRFSIPLVPYASVAFERYNWFVTKGNKWTKRGATNGFSGTLGVALMLDIIDRGAARDLQRETGIQHTALYFDVTKSKVDDFGSSKSWDLSAKNLFWSAGLLLVF
jgi:hypothetical protein